MLFISKKRLEEEVQKRMEEKRRIEDVYREMDRLRCDTFHEMDRLHEHIHKLEVEVDKIGRTDNQGIRETATL